jgi:Galactose oxidase-like, Early set domain/Fibronectin type III domain
MSSAYRPDATCVAARKLLAAFVAIAATPPLNRSLAVRLGLLLTVFVPLAHADNVVGAWSPPAPWPLIAIHSVLTPDGRVLTYGTDGVGTQTGFFIYDVWDPSAGPAAGHLTLPNMTGTDIFCSSQLVLPKGGNIFLAGGDTFVNGKTTNAGNNNTNVFTPASNALARGSNMKRARWYSSSTTLLTGETYIQGGNGGADRPEIRDVTGAFRLLSGANTSIYSWNYPRNFLALDGRVFGFDSTGKMYYVNPIMAGGITAAGQLPGSTSRTVSVAMFRPGRILKIGGASSAAYVIDINGPTPVVTATQSISSVRQWVSATVLADGRVLATGGSAVDNQLTGVNNTAEIWDPDTGLWTRGRAGVNARLYHSGALLLPDARVLIHGGGAPGPLTNLNVEIFTPPYLLDPTGALMPRPSIMLAPDTIEIGRSFSVGFSNASKIKRVTMVKTGSVTHSVNMEQGFLDLGFTRSGSLLNVAGPTRAADAPPGYYMLFVINSKGVPSTARIVHINAPPDTQAPAAPTNLTATAVSATQINLSWAASTDNVAVTAYIVQRCQGAGCTNFSTLATVTSVTYKNTGLTASTTYRYRVRARDPVGNLSAFSPVVSATTLAAP